MLRYLAVASLVVPLAFAQNQTASQDQTNPLIPSGISADCSAFLTAFNTDQSVSGCLTALTTASSAFAPGSAAPSSQAVNTALTNLCSDATTNSCPSAAIRGQLATFWVKCQADLVANPNDKVQEIYDVLYTLLPFKTSLCSKDDGGNYCALAPPTSARDLVDDDKSFSVSELLSTLWNSNAALKRRAPVDAITPNITTFRNTALPFLFITPSLDATALCTSCTRNVATAYIDFASNVPFGPGWARSKLLDSQPALLDAISQKCPATFIGNAVDAAGGLANNGLFSAASTLSVERGSILALVMSAISLAAL